MTATDPLTDQNRARLATRHGAVVMERRTAVMGVLNITPDSFYDGGRRIDVATAVADGVRMVEDGADIIDVGGESTRPGARPVTAAEELARIVPVIRGLRQAVNAPISVDSYKAEVARAALAEGADIINDTSALRFDPEMAAVAAAEQVPVVLMHMQGTPQTMQREPRYENVVQEVRDFLASRIGSAIEAGIHERNIIVDPGIGFGKTVQHNLELLRELGTLGALGAPVLVGVSRKAFIGRILGLEPDERLEGSLAGAVAAVLAGAGMIRVHDVRATCRAVRVADAIRYGIAHS